MELVTILRELWRRRILVAVVAAVAILVGFVAAFHVSPTGLSSRQYHVGIASARALVDTPSSQVVDLGVKADDDANAGVLPARAVLLANLLTSSPLRNEIADEAGIPPDRLIAVADTPTDGQPVSMPLATGATVKASDPRASVVTLHTDVSLPLLTVNTKAPDEKTAARLADATFVVLENHLASLVTDENVPANRRLVVKRLGNANFTTQQRGPSRALAVLAVLVIFGLGCAAILLLSAVARDWRRAVELDELEGAVEAAGDTPVEEAETGDVERSRAAHWASGDLLA